MDSQSPPFINFVVAVFLIVTKALPVTTEENTIRKSIDHNTITAPHSNRLKKLLLFMK